MENITITKEDLARAWKSVSKDYDGIKLKDHEILLKGMLAIARMPISGISPDAQIEQDTMLSVFLQQLMTSAIEHGSKGIEFTSNED